MNRESVSRSRSRSRDNSPINKLQKKELEENAKNDPIKKCFISKSDPLGKRTAHEITQFRQKYEIHIKYHASECPPPFMNFDDCTVFPDSIIEAMRNAGFKGPSPIQAQSWSIVLNGNDFIGISETGSGKTLAFLLPAIIHVKAQTPVTSQDGPVALVMAPTRELAEQIKEEFNKFGRQTGLRAVCMYGGQPKYIQKQQLDRGAEIVIACPGRLNDFLDNGLITLNKVTYLVLDEADRMLDMGFEPQIRKVVARLRQDRQTLLFSATWPEQIQNLAVDFCRQRPVHIQIGNWELTGNSRIKQIIHFVEFHQKQRKLVEILKQYGVAKYIVFCSTKRMCEDLANYLNENGFASTSIHGDKSQEQRDYAMKNYRDNKAKLLIATDVAQRGLDIKDIDYVINYDMTKQIEDYVHRIGRTGRAGKTGTAITFLVQDQDFKIFRPLVEVKQQYQISLQFLKETNQIVPEQLLELS